MSNAASLFDVFATGLARALSLGPSARKSER